MLTLTDQPCLDTFTDPGGASSGATLLMEGGTNGGYFIVASGADVDVQLAYGRYGDWGWTEPFKVGPGNGVIQPGTLGIRFRNHVAGKVATVTAGLSTPLEPAVQLASAGVAGTGLVSLPVVQYIISPGPQSVPDSTVTALLFNTLNGGNDPTGVFTLNANGTVTVNVLGIYFVSLYIRAAVTAATRYTALLSATGPGEIGRNEDTGVNGAVSTQALSILAAGQVVTASFFQNSGAPVNVNIAGLGLTRLG